MFKLAGTNKCAQGAAPVCGTTVPTATQTTTASSSLSTGITSARPTPTSKSRDFF